jgi:hypothetical protein
MEPTSLTAAAGIVLSISLTNTSWAEGPRQTAMQTEADTTQINIAGHPVPVLEGGLYDRYRSNPPLAVIASEAPDLERLKALMPAKVLARVQPLQVWPGRGLDALTAYTYRHCDNDSYNEVGLSIVTNAPDSISFGPFTLMRQSMSNAFCGHVLKLPVNTELARVRGVVGYNLPKLLTGIDYKENDTSGVVEIFDSETKALDVRLEARKLSDLSSSATLVTNSFINIDLEGRVTTGHAVSRELSHASSSNEDSVRFTLTEGSLSAYIKTLKLGKMVKYEYVPEFQSALYAPKPL